MSVDELVGDSDTDWLGVNKGENVGVDDALLADPLTELESGMVAVSVVLGENEAVTPSVLLLVTERDTVEFFDAVADVELVCVGVGE